jgi:hypothetical protein
MPFAPMSVLPFPPPPSPGPAALGPLSLTSVTYTSALLLASGLPSTLHPKDCTIVQSHTRIQCTMVAGVGGSLQWAVTVAGQTSALPRTRYHPPELIDVGVGPGAGAGAGAGPPEFTPTARAALPTSGGAVLAFLGDFLGPPGRPLPITAVGTVPGPGGGAAPASTVSTSACRVQGDGHRVVWCVSPPGVGAGHVWTLSVAGQASNPSPTTTSYAPPAVVTVAVSGRGTFPNDDPGAVPCAGGAVVTLVGSNFGDDPGRVGVTWAGVPVPGLLLTASHTTLTFPSPPGVGPTAAMVLTVGGQAVGVLSPAPSAAPVPLQVPYGRPRVTGVALRGPPMDCSLVGVDGWPVGAGGRTRVALYGVNFGVGVVPGTEAGPVVTVQGVPCDVVPGTSMDDHVECYTALCAGEGGGVRIKGGGGWRLVWCVHRCLRPCFVYARTSTPTP